MTKTIQDIGVISPNLLKLFEDCPMKFYYRYIEQIPAPNLDKNFTTGKNIHALASYYLKNLDIEKFEHALNSKESVLWSYLKQTPYFVYDVVGIEKYISVKLDSCWIGGRIDAIVKDNEDYYILDYKTGDVKDDMTYDFQTMIYLLVCDEMYSQKNSISFIYLDLKQQREVKIILTKELKQDYKQKLSYIYKKIYNFNPKKFAPSEICKCEYSKICLTHG